MTSTHPTSDDGRTMVDHMAGFLAAGSLVLSGLAQFGSPALYAPIAAILAFAAARMSWRNRRLATVATVVSALAFVVGMTLAVITESSII